jgi:hypothetical protein
MLKLLIEILGGVAVILAVVFLNPHNRKRRYIIRCAEDASPEQLEAIYHQIESCGGETPACAILARTNARSGGVEDLSIPVPPYVQPWAGRVISAEGGGIDLAFRFSSSRASPAIVRGKQYRIVPVLRQRTKSGKPRNQYSPKKYMSNNPDVLRPLQAVCSRYPAELLGYLLATGCDSFECEPTDQTRIGGSPSWVQDPEFPKCGVCQKSMSMILQLPGSLLPGKPSPEGMFFFFGCATHPEETKTDAQFY